MYIIYLCFLSSFLTRSLCLYVYIYIYAILLHIESGGERMFIFVGRLAQCDNFLNPVTLAHHNFLP